MAQEEKAVVGAWGLEEKEPVFIVLVQDMMTLAQVVSFAMVQEKTIVFNAIVEDIKIAMTVEALAK